MTTDRTTKIIPFSKQLTMKYHYTNKVETPISVVLHLVCKPGRHVLNPPPSDAYTRSPSQDSPSQDFRQGLGCSGTHLFIGSG